MPAGNIQVQFVPSGAVELVASNVTVSPGAAILGEGTTSDSNSSLLQEEKTSPIARILIDKNLINDFIINCLWLKKSVNFMIMLLTQSRIKTR